MKTESMQKMLEGLFDAGKIEAGHKYDLMPSDCAGNGYDIAYKSRPDESGDYEVQGHLMRVKCAVKVGSRNWHEGIPCGYTLICDPASPYNLRAGEHAEVIHRDGNNIGNGYMHRVLASIAIVRGDGSKVYRGHTPYWLGSTNTYASHYISGLCRRDRAAYDIEVAQLQSVCDMINATAAKEVAA